MLAWPSISWMMRMSTPSDSNRHVPSCLRSERRGLRHPPIHRCAEPFERSVNRRELDPLGDPEVPPQLGAVRLDRRFDLHGRHGGVGLYRGPFQNVYPTPKVSGIFSPAFCVSRFPFE